MKINFFKKENSFRKKNFQPNANLDWKIFVGSALIMIFLSSFFSYHLFILINQDSFLPESGENGQVPALNINRMEKMLDYFSAREKKSAEIINSPAPVVDPSL